ncbi:alpha/beta fold hydrolase [Blastococcus sp. PRF04-17]|uniref:alpha/beta fold hydrolase n=1 Tax=Blastococcus sp. PRF04-17 TaxID=2933797 RepID=UPI001FF6857F|nr:alpha/beta hydrolase [Blastococcus sp. PRF04-17]UOY03102.1 alpha/beta hydrolase [Blastococcus sp. PRF04-17]
MPTAPVPPSPSLPAPTGPPPPGSRTVTTDDGVPLHVEVDGNLSASLTVVLSHGFTARLAEWELQRAALRDRVRLVLWDQRGHGRSGWTRLTRATIDRTGRDLGQVLDATTPTGPVVLAGHSMGGMSVLALARQRPELFGDRVVGAFLLATSAGGLVETGLLGLAVKVVRALHLLTLYLRFLELIAPLLERFRRRGTRIGRRVVRRLLFGADDADLANVRLVQALLEETPWPVAMAFYATFLDHDETAALEVLRKVPVTVVAATHDRLTPAAHGRAIADTVGENAELVVVPGAGHSVNLTRTAAVDQAFHDLLDRVEQRAPKAG